MSRKITGGGRFSGQRRWTLTFIIVVALLIPAAAAFGATPGDSGTVPPPTPPSNICVEGTVIDWNEEPLTEGWIVFPTAPDGMAIAGKGPEVDDDGEATNKFSFNSDEDGLYEGDWTFTIDYSELVGNWESVEPYTDSFTIPLEANGHECYQIRFKLREVVEVLVYKIDRHHKLLDDWKITAKPAHGNYFASEETGETGDDGKGMVKFELTPGEWYFYEKPPKDADYDADPFLPDDGKQKLTIKSADDDAQNHPYVIRFKNIIKQTCIEVKKTDSKQELPEGADPADYYLAPSNLAGWKITVLYADGSVAAYDYTDATGYVKFEDLPPGPYTVVEEERPGWESDGPSRYDVTVTNSSECSMVNFMNRQVPLAYKIKGHKLDANGHYGVPGWEITIRPADKNGYVPPVPTDDEGDSLCTDEDSQGSDPSISCTFTNGLGEYEFTLPYEDYRVPGSTYHVCEEQEDGWLPHTATCYTIHIPHDPTTIHVHDFINQQVGHTESGKPDGPYQDHDGYGCHYHDVRPGESLFGIGSKYGASPQSMLDANSWVRSRPHYYLRPGDKVCIP